MIGRASSHSSVAKVGPHQFFEMVLHVVILSLYKIKTGDSDESPVKRQICFCYTAGKAGFGMEIGSEKSTSKFMHISMHMHISIIMVPVVNVVFFMISSPFCQRP